jgi:hypothetical protein
LCIEQTTIRPQECRTSQSSYIEIVMVSYNVLLDMTNVALGLGTWCTHVQAANISTSQMPLHPPSLPSQVYKPVTRLSSYQSEGNTFAADPAAALGDATVNSINQATGVDMTQSSVPSGFTAAPVVSVRLLLGHAPDCSGPMLAWTLRQSPSRSGSRL